MDTAAENMDRQPPQWTGDVWIQDQWTEEDKAKARSSLSSSSPFCLGLKQDDENQKRLVQLQQFRRHASTNWNEFYKRNKTNFFKDRHYLHKAFPNEFAWMYNTRTDHVNIEVNNGGTSDDTIRYTPGNSNVTKDKFCVVEVGCGVGNAILPLLEQHSKVMQQHSANVSLDSKTGHQSFRAPPPQLLIHCLDFAPNAIHLLQKDTRFQTAASEGRATAHVYDLSSMHPSQIDICHPDQVDIHSHLTPTTLFSRQTLANSADVAILLFCLSAIGPHPSLALCCAARNVIDMLRPGGTLVIRDYGRLDEAQFKLETGQKKLCDNFYRKGDGTGCYYFELKDLKDLFVAEKEDDTKLEQLELEYIHRVYRNRGDGTTRRRVWIQGRFRKPMNQNSTCISMKQYIDPIDRMSDFFDNSVRLWDDHYRTLPSNASSPLSMSSNLFQIFPDEFRPWILRQSQNRLEKKSQDEWQTMSYKTPVFSSSCITVTDLGCGLGNETLLDIIECQAISHGEDNVLSATCSSLDSPKPPLLNIHFIDSSGEAINRLRNDPRYERATANKVSAAKVTSEQCNFASTHSVMDQSADIILLLFSLSAIGPYRRHHHHSDENNSASKMMIKAVQNAVNMLKDDGIILFRDYARFDDDQLQLNSVVGAQLCENFYVRCENKVHDDSARYSTTLSAGTGCYFFDLDDVRELFTGVGLEVIQLEYTSTSVKKSGKYGRDCTRNGGVVGRTRVCVLGKFRKRSRCDE